MASKFAWIAIAVLFCTLPSIHCQAYLTPNYYDYMCPQALPTIHKTIRNAIAQELEWRLHSFASTSMTALFRYIKGCDGSVLLKDTPWFTGEQTAVQNNNSIRGMDIIEVAKQAVEAVCPGVVSCADILALAARDSSEYVNGPTWTVNLGRRDSTTANKNLATADLPFADDNLDVLIGKFTRKGLDAKELVALSGAHTIGKAACATFRNRIYNETNIDPGFAIHRRLSCPSNNAGNANLALLDPVTPYSLDNKYYKNLMRRRGLLHSDQVLFNRDATDGIVASYSKNQSYFFAVFAASMVKMGDIDPLTGSSGEIRKICSAIN